MNKRNSLIVDQYKLDGLYEDILERLKKQGVDLNNVCRHDVSGVDEFHLRGAEVSEELMNQFDLSDLRVLDVGCGLGGPCRMLADKFNCTVSGIDMSHEYIRTAKNLSELIRTNGEIEYQQGDALDLPYKENTFDVVWTQHVQMNIEDKKRFYYEINRVLKDNGKFVYYDIFKKGAKDIFYPVPWANNPSVSFLGTISNMDSILSNLGMGRLKSINQTDGAIDFIHDVFNKVKINGSPTIDLNILMGTSTKDKLTNVLKGLEGGRIELQSGIYQKNNQ